MSSMRSTRGEPVLRKPFRPPEPPTDGEVHTFGDQPEARRFDSLQARTGGGVNLDDALAEALVREGVEVLFTLVDDTILPLVQAAKERGIRIIATRHEQAAVAMADGYARASNRLGVAAVGAGPAVAQIGTALATASRHRSDVAVFAGRTARGLGHHVKRFDEAPLVTAAGATPFPLVEVADAARVLTLALDHVEQGSGPVVLGIPSDLFDSECSPIPPRPARTVRSGEPDEAPLVEAVGALTQARRPILLAGRGAVQSGARQAIIELARRSGALLATTLQARGWFEGVERDISLMGSLASPETRAMVRQADLLVAIGTTLNAYVQGSAFGDELLAPDVQLLQIDTNPAAIGRYLPVDHRLVGDATKCVQALCERTAWPAVGQWKAPNRTPRTRPEAPAGAPLAARSFLASLDAMLPDVRSVTLDCGLFTFAALDQIRCDPEFFHWTLDFGSMGLAIPIGLGAALGRPDVPAYILVGDGGLAMTLSELMTAASHAIPVTIVVLDDGGFGAEVRILEQRGKPPELARYENPDFAAVARALGLDATTVTKAEDLAELRAILGRDRAGPLVVHVRIERDVYAEAA
jgi:acetolactate synthase-1/2/3 large subunit